MYENAKISTTSTLAAGQCTPQMEQLTNLCNNISGASREIDSLSECIRSKIFGARPQEGESAKEPCSIEDVLSLAKQTLDSAIRTLCGIDDRL
jgi:hypothetical protein